MVRTVAAALATRDAAKGFIRLLGIIAGSGGKLNCKDELCAAGLYAIYTFYTAAYLIGIVTDWTVLGPIGSTAESPSKRASFSSSTFQSGRSPGMRCE